MEWPAALEEEHLSPPPRLFERLRQIPGYIWDESKQPVHSSYGNWHVFGSKNSRKVLKPSPTPQASHAGSGRGSPRFNKHSQAGSVKGTSNDDTSEASESDDDEWDKAHMEVVAKISTHALREERAYYICKSLSRSVDPHGDHIVRPVDFLRLTSQQGDKSPIVVAIFKSAGNNALLKYMDFGPAWYRSGDFKDGGQIENALPLIELIPIPTFLDFAISATECLEILHHGQRIVHGEIRGDAFHLNEETGQVKLINFGSGLRSFEHGLTSSGWSAISKEPGAKTKLSYISPEQTGRMPAEPDSRTDIYSLGILFWTMLTQQPAFDGPTPMDIIQGVLGRRLPSVSSVRLDVPDVIGNIISKMTAKSISERYHSASGLRHDLIEVQRLLDDGESAALKNWKIAVKDVSSFFILPNVMIGRSQEHDEIVKIIDKVSKRHMVAQSQGVYSLSSGSSLLDVADGSSYSGNSSRDERRDSVAIIGHDPSDLRPIASNSSFLITTSTTSSQPNSHDSQDSIRSFTQLKPWERTSALTYDTKSSMDASGIEGEGARSSSDGVGSLSSQKNNPKFRRQGRCEVISITGAAGLGKSCLVQSVQVEARRRGYFASSKFDQARSTAFGPVLKLLSSLFKQVFSEIDTDTPFHRVLKQYVQPAWPMLSRVLGLPEFLLGPSTSYLKKHSSAGLDRSSLLVYSKNQSSKQLGKIPSPGYNKSLHADYPRRASSPTSSRGSLYSMGLGAQSSHDFLLSGSSTKSMRLMNTFLDVLRTFAHHKFICFSLDDLQFADPESLELISQIILSRIKIVIMVTYRPDEMLPERIKNILEPPDSEGHLRANGVGITRLVLQPLKEDDITQYVAATLCKPVEDIIPLAAVIQAKTAGSPFYMREMLDACHRKNCIWYDYKKSLWQYDLDRIFQHFSAEKYDDVLNNDFVARRLKELPTSSRSILSWASLIGSSFSFELIRRLLSDEFDYDDSENTVSTSGRGPYSLSHSQQDAVGGLQAAIQAYIIVATENDDCFRFAHDRYIQAAASLRPNGPKMHFIIAQTLLKYYFSDEKSQENIASHICEAIDIIKKRVVHRQSYRKLLFDCAQAAAESGARTTAAKFYANCFALLQKNPWDDAQPDVYYDETLALYTRAAECYHYMSRYDDAMSLLSVVFACAKTAVDKAPAWILQSRLYALCGDSTSAFQALKSCLLALGIEVDDNPTFEKCDAEFERLSLKIQTTDQNELISPKLSKESNLASVGAVLVEIVSAAFWSDPLTFYQMSLVFVNMHMTCGSFPQSGLSFIHLATIAIARFNMVSFANDMGSIALDLMDRWRDPYTLGRGNVTYSYFVAHIQSPLTTSISQLEGCLEHSIQAGDRISTLLNFGVIALLKFFASEHLAELELFCQYGPEEIPNWQYDCRGGTLLIAVRQASRALQGKTFHGQSPVWDIMSDETHNTARYLSWIKTSTVNYERPIWIYESIQIAPLFLYGYYEKAVQIGRKCINNMDTMWSGRNTRFLLLIHGLSLAGLVWNRVQDPRLSDSDGDSLAGQIEETVKELRLLRKKIVDWQVINPVNFYAGSAMLDAQIAELVGDHGSTLRHYEDCLDHANANSFIFEEALGNYLLAGFFLRRGARRSAKAALRETIMLYRQLGAVGMAKYIEEEHSLLLMGPVKNLRTVEVGVQTDFAGDSAPVQYHALEEDGRHQTQVSITETKGERIDAWQSGSARPDAGGLPALDMLDLTSILESSQVISSVLQVDQLLTTMCEIILQNCGGVATLAAIIVEEDDPSPGWSVAASGDSENGARAHIPGLPLSETPEIDESVILYCTRFRETVFLPDLVRDERFSNVTEAWWARYPQGKSVIAIPIAHGVKPLLGALYLQGHRNAFTDRNLTVLQLLVNQISISYSNALTLKAIEKVSASNISMVQSQKRALGKAKEAEAKAKLAEAEAIRNVKLAEEAAKAKSIFLANVSHELRTPLNGVIGNSELLRVSGNLSKEQAEMSDSIRVSADLLLTVINDILDFSKMEADRMELFNVAFNPDEMLREVVRSMSYSSQDQKMKEVEIKRDFQLPQTLIYGDPVRLHQVLGNLIGNSLKFTEHGSITVGARVDEETMDHVKLTFWVKDTGIGIPASQIEKLFKPFSQADASTARKYGGSGLGLSICKSLIESMMHGKIELQSHENVGTTVRFSVVFPKADPEASVGDTQTGSEQRDPMVKYIENVKKITQISYIDFSSTPREKLRICIAEDNPINQKIAIQFVQKLGFVYVDAYDNGLATVEGLRRKAREGTPYHLVLMDCQMPIMDGYESTKLLRKDENEAVRGVLVIAMTASAIQGDREKCLESGMNDYLAKPVRVHVLRKKLEEYLHQPLGLMPNTQAETNKVTNNVVKTANGAITPQNDSLTPHVISSSMKIRPSPPTRTSSKPKLSDISNTITSKTTRSGRSSNRTLGPEFTNKLDTSFSRSIGIDDEQVSPGSSSNFTGSTMHIDTANDATPTEREGRNAGVDSESTLPQSWKDDDRLNRMVYTSRVEPLVLGKARERRTQA